MPLILIRLTVGILGALVVMLSLIDANPQPLLAGIELRTTDEVRRAAPAPVRPVAQHAVTVAVAHHAR